MKTWTPHYGADPVSGVRVLATNSGKAFMADCTLTKVPADGKTGYQKNCTLQVTNSTTGTSGLYINLGTDTSCAFRPLVVAGTIGDTTELTASIAQINSLATASARVVVTSATSLSLTSTQHANKIVLITTNSTGTSTFSLPATTGGCDRYVVVNGVVQTQGTIVIQTASAADVFAGVVTGLHTTTTTGGEAFVAVGGTPKSTITLNKTTTGGLGFDWFEFIDVADYTNQSVPSWLVKGQISGSGSLATPFS